MVDSVVSGEAVGPSLCAVLRGLSVVARFCKVSLLFWLCAWQRRGHGGALCTHDFFISINLIFYLCIYVYIYIYIYIKKKKNYIYIYIDIYGTISSVMWSTQPRGTMAHNFYRLIYHHNYGYIAHCLVMQSHHIAPTNTILSQNEEESEIYRSR